MGKKVSRPRLKLTRSVCLGGSALAGRKRCKARGALAFGFCFIGLERARRPLKSHVK